MYESMYVRMYRRWFVCMYVCMYVCMCVYICILRKGDGIGARGTFRGNQAQAWRPRHAFVGFIGLRHDKPHKN